MDWYFYPLLIIAGLIAGFVNTVAGSGSLITLPLLMFIGLPANIANATNRVGILLQSAVGAVGYRQSNVFHFREGLWLALPATASGAGETLPPALPGLVRTSIGKDLQPTPREAFTTYNNFVELGPDKESPAKNAHLLHGRPWTVRVDGECEAPGEIGIE